jgi:hypothetical protein
LPGEHSTNGDSAGAVVLAACGATATSGARRFRLKQSMALPVHGAERLCYIAACPMGIEAAVIGETR